MSNIVSGGSTENNGFGLKKWSSQQNQRRVPL